MGLNSSKADDDRRQTGMTDLSRQANKIIQDRMKEINSKIQEFDTKVLKKGIIDWMETQVTKMRTGSVTALKTKKFNEILLKLLRSLDSTIYGKIVSTMMWTMSHNHIDINSPRIHQDLMQYYLQQVYDDHRDRTSSDINLFREFVDCWVSIESIEILNHIIYFAMELDDPAYFNVNTVYKTKVWPKNDNSDLRNALVKTLENKPTYVIKYLEERKFKMNSQDSVEKMKKLQFFMNQISEESKTISTFLFELFRYIFQHMAIPITQKEQASVNEVITRFLFSKKSNLLAILLYLVRVIHSKEHNMFCEKKLHLEKVNDKRILRPSQFFKYLRKRENPHAPYDIHFTHDLSSTRRNLKKELVDKHLVKPVRTYEDLIDRLIAFAHHLVDFSVKDHFFIYFWVDILEHWIFEVFHEEIDMDTTLEILHIIIKYLQSSEVVVYLFAVEKLHGAKISNHQLYQLFKNTLIIDVQLHEEEEGNSLVPVMNFDQPEEQELMELRSHRSHTRATGLNLSTLPVILELKESLFESDKMGSDQCSLKASQEPETQDDQPRVSGFAAQPETPEQPDSLFGPSLSSVV